MAGEVSCLLSNSLTVSGARGGHDLPTDRRAVGPNSSGTRGGWHGRPIGTRGPTPPCQN